MAPAPTRRRQADDPPWSRVNAFRIGGGVGALAGAVVAVVAGVPWFVLVGAVVGSAVGYGTQRWQERHQHGRGDIVT